MALRDLSGSLFIDLVNELKVLDRPDMPVLFAVDQYNNWEIASAYSYRGARIPAKQLAVPHALNFLSLKKAETADWKMANGMCIGTLVFFSFSTFFFFGQFQQQKCFDFRHLILQQIRVFFCFFCFANCHYFLFSST